MPQAARIWAETGALLCEVLAAELDNLRQGAAQTGPSAIRGPDLHCNQELSQEGSEPTEPEQGIYSNTILDSSVHDAGPAAVRLQAEHCSPGSHAAPHSLSNGADPVASVSGCSQTQDSHSMAAQHESKAGARQLQQQRGLTAWAQVLPPGAEPAAHASIPEPPAEFAAVLCAAWRALLPAALAPGGGSEQSIPDMPFLAQPEGANNCSDDQACPLPGSHGHPGKKQRTAAEASEGAALPASVGGKDPAPASALGGDIAGLHQQEGLEGQGLDFRLLGEPAGLTSSQAQPISKAALTEALTSEPGMSGQPPSQQRLLVNATRMPHNKPMHGPGAHLVLDSPPYASCLVADGPVCYAGIGGEQLERLEHIAHGAAMCQAYAAGLLQVRITCFLTIFCESIYISDPQQ